MPVPNRKDSLHWLVAWMEHHASHWVTKHVTCFNQVTRNNHVVQLLSCTSESYHIHCYTLYCIIPIHTYLYLYMMYLLQFFPESVLQALPGRALIFSSLSCPAMICRAAFRDVKFKLYHTLLRLVTQIYIKHTCATTTVFDNVQSCRKLATICTDHDIWVANSNAVATTKEASTVAGSWAITVRQDFCCPSFKSPPWTLHEGMIQSW